MVYKLATSVNGAHSMVYRFAKTMKSDIRIELDRESCKPLHRQVYDSLKRFIIDGELPPGTKMPSSRDLAAQLKIARSTAILAYDQLMADGYFQTLIGKGTYVSRELPTLVLRQRRRLIASVDVGKFHYALSAYGQYLSVQEEYAQEGPLLRSHSVAHDHFPLYEWKQLLLRRLRTVNSKAMEYPDDQGGYPPLRAAIAAYLSDSRGVSCAAEQVLITNGSQQALDLIARIHMQSGDLVGVEDPGYFLAKKCFAAYGAELVPIPVDNLGLMTQHVDLLEQPLKALYTTPSHQFPLGGTLPLSRRLVLLEWAQSTNTILIEDDYDSEFRFEGRPLSALQGLDTSGSVIYTGSFSKVLYPALRLAYMVVPKALMEIYTYAKRLTDHSSPVLPQMVLADFMENGLLQKHIVRMRSVYSNTRQLLIAQLQKYFGSQVSIIGENAGLHLTVSFQISGTEESILAAADVARIPLRSTKRTYLQATRVDKEFVLPYASLTENVIREGMARLATELQPTGSG